MSEIKEAYKVITQSPMLSYLRFDAFKRFYDARKVYLYKVNNNIAGVMIYYRKEMLLYSKSLRLMHDIVVGVSHPK